MKCEKCKDTGIYTYYHDAGDHFSGCSSPYSEWRTEECECVKKRRNDLFEKLKRIKRHR